MINQMAFKRVFEFNCELGLKQKKVTPTEARREDLLLTAAHISNWDLAFLYAVHVVGHATAAEIGLVVGMDRPTVARCLRSLLASGSIRRTASDPNRDDAFELSERGARALLTGLRLWTCAKHELKSHGTEPKCLLQRRSQDNHGSVSWS
jgi:DNA-binding MarR family transcriptional regulator